MCAQQPLLGQRGISRPIRSFARHTLLRPATSRRQGLVCGSQYNFVLYTKPECPLCDGLKDKMQGLIDRAQFMPSFLTGATLEARDISTNEEWQGAMRLSVPVLAVLDAQGSEVVLPRPQPRLTAERLQRHLEEALAALGGEQQQQQ
eukprot:GHRQ01033235.1.p1 GENE.GHRQ01033235.1~~GHRQ01033235.1.p1  ORF type:complete len:162 (+),score=75.42 GHRQ01033235.1:48-488(+)